MQSRGLIDDSRALVLSSAQATAKRSQLRKYIFGADELPSGLPTVTSTITSPVSDLTNLDTCDQLDFAIVLPKSTGANITVHLRAYHFKADADRLDECVLFCGGHTDTNDDDKTASPSNIGYGDWRMIESLLNAGFDVISYFMPGIYPGNGNACEANWGAPGGASPHPWLVANVPDSTSGTAIRLFLTMPIVCMNYLVSIALDFAAIVGLSGGGWTATWAQALDPRFTSAYSIMGSEPLYIRAGSAIGDDEQFHVPLYTQVGYLDLYAMAADRGKFVSIRGAGDSIFGESTYDATVHPRLAGKTWTQAVTDFSDEVTATAALLGSGTYTLHLDTQALTHQISWQTAAWIVAELTA
jgi:hypothetical protein